MSALCHLSARTTYKRRLFIKALVILAATRLAMTFLGMGRLRAFLGWLADRAAAPQAHDDYAMRVAAAVTSAAAYVPGANSLAKALATLTLMRCRGLRGNLRLAAAGARVLYKGIVIIGENA
jgi:hypothetical protein